MSPRRELRRSLLYRLLASAFQYPDQTVAAAICSTEFIRALRAAAIAVDATGIVEQIDLLGDAVSRTLDADLDLSAEYVALFTRNVPCSPYGSRYLVRDVMARPRVLSEVIGYYSAFGVEVDRAHPDLPDHIGTELEFVGYLLAKEVYARDAGWDERAAICRDARRRFLSDHLLLWFPMFRANLREHARLAFYPAIADIVLALLEDDANAMGDAAVQSPQDYRQADGPLKHAGSGEVSAVRVGRAIADEEGDEDESTFDCGIISR